MQGKKLKTLKEGDDSSAALYDYAPAGYFALDSNSLICELNLSAASMLGKERSMLIKCNFNLFVSQDTLPDFNCFFKELWNTKNKQICEIRIIASENSQKYVHIEGVIDRIDDKCHLSVVDITKRKQSEEELRLSNEKYKLLTESIQDVAWTLDIEAERFLYVSPSVQKLRGYTAEEIMSVPVFETMSPELRESLKIITIQRVQDYFSRNGEDFFYTDEIEQLCKDGSSVWTEVITKYSLNKTTGKIEIHGVTRNIDKRKRAEIALKNSLDKYHVLYENTQVMLQSSNSLGEIILVNKFWLKVMGYEFDEVINTKASKYLTAESVQKHKVLFPKLIENGFLNDFEFQAIKKNGEIIDLTASSTIEYDDKGEMVKTITYLIDITERKKAEKRLKESEMKFAKAFDQNFTITGFSLLDTGTYVEVNQTFCDKLEFTKEEVVGKKSVDIIKLDPVFRKTMIAKLQKENKITNAETIIYTKTGKPLNVLISAEIIELENVKYNYTVAVDITELKNVQQELTKEKEKAQESNKRLKEAQSIAKMGNWEYNLITDNLFWSDEIYRIFECDPNTFNASYQGFLEFVYPDDRERVNDAYVKSLKTGKDYEIEHRIITKNNSIKYLWEKCSTDYDDNKKPLKSHGVVLDITVHKTAEQALKQSETQLKELNATKDKLFSIIGHDLRSPFSCILGLSELMNLKSKKYTEERYKEINGMIYSAAKQTLYLLENLLTWARTQTGQINFKPVHIILEPVVQEIIKALNISAIAKEISIIYVQNKKISLYADQNMLQTILRNLLSNAIKFTNVGGMIEISAKSNHRQIEICVSDNGVGIRKDVIKKLFRIDSNITTKGTASEKGSGLGLILCKEFVEKHGGKIWVESQEGTGSNFKFTIPVFNLKPAIN